MERKMTLEQTLIQEVLHEAGKQCRTICNNAGLIAETELLAATLSEAMGPTIREFSPVVTVHTSHLTARIQATYMRLSDIRAAIAKADLKIESEAVCDGTGYQSAGDVVIRLSGFNVYIDCVHVAEELAEAA